MNVRIMIACASVALLVGLAVACDEKKPDATPGTSSAASTTTAPAGTAETEEDFEEEAAGSITPDNLESELAKLEAEIK